MGLRNDSQGAHLLNEDFPREVMQARVQLMLGEPYLASAIARLPVVNADGLGWCDTMATDGYYIYVNPAFCAALTQKEIVFVFAHEVMHCVLGHIDRRQDRQHALWNEAIDYATNLMLVQLGMKMPKVGLLDQKYSGKTAEDIYANPPSKIQHSTSSSCPPPVTRYPPQRLRRQSTIQNPSFKIQHSTLSSTRHQPKIHYPKSKIKTPHDLLETHSPHGLRNFE